MENLITKYRVARSQRILTRAFRKLRKTYRELEKQASKNE